MSDTTEPLRILHVMGSMEYGGIQTWLMHMLRNIDRDRFRMDFMVHRPEEQPHDAEIRQLGSKVIPCSNPRNPVVYAWNFRRLLDEHGPYDIVHSHVHHFSGVPLILARGFGIKHRIAHSHNDKTRDHSDVGKLRELYLKTMRESIRRNATLRLAVSERAARSLYGPDWSDAPDVELLNLSIELEPFENARDADEVRRELGLPTDIPVIGHVGSFTRQKNHSFFLEIVDELHRRGEDFHIILVGDGPLREDVEYGITRRNLDNRITLLGLRDDVPELMVAAMDLFLFPSNYEGLGLVLIEAQAGATPCVFSDVVPGEVDIIPQLLERLSLDQPPSEWANAVAQQLDADASMSRREAFGAILDSRFSLQRSVAGLEEIYERGTTPP